MIVFIEDIKLMDISDLDLNLLVVLDAMFEEGRTTRVAERLGISQPMVSYALGKLRRSLDDELFVRVGNGMRPTRYAESLHAPVREVMRRIREEILRPAQFDPSVAQRTLTLCMSDMGEMLFLPPILDRLAKEAPGIRIQCLALPRHEVEAGLSDGAIDFAIGYFPDLAGAAIMRQGLFAHPFALVLREGHPLLEFEFTLDHYRQAKHIIVKNEGRVNQLLEFSWKKIGLTGPVMVELPHYLSLPYIVSSTDFIATIPMAAAKYFSRLTGVRCVDLPFEMPRVELKQYWHQRSHSDECSIWFRGLVAELFLNKDPSSHVFSLTQL